MKHEPIELYKPVEKLEIRDDYEDSPAIFRKVNCPSCQQEVNSGNLNLDHNMAKCGACNALFSIEKIVESIKSKEVMNQEIVRPEGIDLFYYKNDLDITVQQHLQGIDGAGILLFPSFAFFSIPLYLFKGLHIAFPIVLTLISLYFIFRMFNYSKRNKIHININSRILRIEYRPKNLRNDKSYAIDEIDQLYVKPNSSGYYTIFMAVNGIEGQKHVQLLSVNTLSKAKFLEQEIERYLSIEDKKIPEANV